MSTPGRISEYYDRVAGDYDRHRSGGGSYIAPIVELLEHGRGRRVLELGPGTGNNTAALHGETRCEISALEPSSGMLAQARAKGVPARFIQGSATAMPFSADSFDFVFAIYVLHHISDLAILMAECARVLDGGAAAFVTAPEWFIERHPMNAYFPSFAKVDIERFQSVEEVRAALGAAGFRETGVEAMAAEPKPVDQEYVDKIAGKFISTYDLIPEDEFDAGLARLRREVAEKGQLDCTVTWEAVTIWGRV
jgi:ubiquinone/menaquinone biosynthesis C-methylase UbiE